MTLPENEEVQTDSPPSKRLKLDETSQTSTSSSIGLLSFCDDLLLEIFSYLRPPDLLSLSRCCQRLQRVVFDRTLWTFVDFKPTKLTHRELEKYVKFFLPTTKLISTKGFWTFPPIINGEIDVELNVERGLAWEHEEATFTGELMERITRAAPNLTTLKIENHVFDSQDISLEKLPPKLEHLSLRSCHLSKLNMSGKSYFFGIDKYLPQLKILDVCGCYWLESHSFLALSKCKHLQELRVAGCLIAEFVPYVSLGTRFGFTSLTVVDFRRTWVSDREVSCLNKTPTLRELYLESPGGVRGAGLISDLAVTAFGGTLEQWNEMGYFVVLMTKYDGFKPSSLRVIEMRNFVGVTDTSLRHCAGCLKGLKQLNVRGTSCTQAGVIKFKTQRPDVLIESNFDHDIDIDSNSNTNNT